MKKGKIVKFSAATMVALSAITPVAAFASEAGTQDGFIQVINLYQQLNSKNV